MKNKRNIFKIAILALFVAAAIFLVKYFGLSEILNPATIKDKVLAFGMLAPLVYMIFYALATVAFVPGAPLTVAGGALFGALMGTFYTVIGATVGATFAFLFARFLGRGFIGAVESEKFKTLDEYDKKIEENGLGVVLFLRFAPLFPFNGLNFALGLTKVTLKDYFFGTLFGIIPGTFAYTYFGESLASLNPGQIFLAVLVLVALSIGAGKFGKKK